jgi:hypothetical protein
LVISFLDIVWFSCWKLYITRIIHHYTNLFKLIKELFIVPESLSSLLITIIVILKESSSRFYIAVAVADAVTVAVVVIGVIVVVVTRNVAVALRCHFEISQTKYHHYVTTLFINHRRVLVYSINTYLNVHA